MPSVVRISEPQQQDVTTPRKKFKTVLGLSASVFKDPDHTIGQLSPGIKAGPPRRVHTLTRKSIDTARNYTQRRKRRADRSSVTDISFFEPDAILIPSASETSDPIPTIPNMKTVTNTSRRPPVRMDAQDGPWSVSVAETPHDARSYSLYIKSKCTCFHLPFFTSAGLPFGRHNPCHATHCFEYVVLWLKILFLVHSSCFFTFNIYSCSSHSQSHTYSNRHGDCGFASEAS